MLQQIRLNSSALRSPGIGPGVGIPPTNSPGLRGVPAWFDHDEFSIQGPRVALSPVSTATTPPQSHRAFSPGTPSIVVPALHRQRSKSSPPIFEPCSALGPEPNQFPFPDQFTSTSKSVPLGITHKVNPVSNCPSSFDQSLTSKSNG